MKCNLCHNLAEAYYLSKVLCMLININLLTTNYMTSLIPCLNFTVNLFCDAVFFFTDTSGNCRSKYAVKLNSFSMCYSLKIYQETGLGNDSMPDMFSSFLLPCVYHTIRYVQTEISLVLMLSRKQTNVSPILPLN